MIPRIIHFVFFGLTPFERLHYLAIRTARHHHPDFDIVLHNTIEPRGKWWEAARPMVRREAVEIPNGVFDRPVAEIAHRADIVRMQKLLERGGIYLDLDVLTLKPLDEFLAGTTPVMGLQGGGRKGLCNAVIIAPANDPFMMLWREAYRQFDPSQWDFHSVRVPWMLAMQWPEKIRVLPQEAFFPIGWNSAAQFFSPAHARPLDASWTVHLWARLWGKRGLLSDEALDRVMRGSTFDRYFGAFLRGG